MGGLEFQNPGQTSQKLNICMELSSRSILYQSSAHSGNGAHIHCGTPPGEGTAGDAAAPTALP